jgi:hypothetical protein
MGGGFVMTGAFARDGLAAVLRQLRLLRNLGLVTGMRSGKSVASLYDRVAMLLDQAVCHIEHLRPGISGAPAQAAVLSRLAKDVVSPVRIACTAARATGSWLSTVCSPRGPGLCGCLCRQASVRQ